MDARAEGAQHRAGEPGVPTIPEQVVLAVEGARPFRVRRLSSCSGIRWGFLCADDADPLRLHRLRQEIQMVGQSEEAPEGGLR